MSCSTKINKTSELLFSIYYLVNTSSRSVNMQLAYDMGSSSLMGVTKRNPGTILIRNWARLKHTKPASKNGFLGVVGRIPKLIFGIGSNNAFRHEERIQKSGHANTATQALGAMLAAVNFKFFLSKPMRSSPCTPPDRYLLQPSGPDTALITMLHWLAHTKSRWKTTGCYFSDTIHPSMFPQLKWRKWIHLCLSCWNTFAW